MRSELAQKNEVATVVVSLAVKPGLEDKFKAWQDRVDQQVAAFPGFLGTDRVSPVPGIQADWVVIYRFDTFKHLEAWANSPERKELQAEDSELFTRPPKQTAMGGGDVADSEVTAVIPHKVKPGRTEEYLAVQHQFEIDQSKFPGFLGSETLKPAPGTHDEWTTLLRFDTAEHLDEWLRSPRRAELVKSLDASVDKFEVNKIGSSFGSWFKFSTVDGQPTPNWKQAMAVLVALYPLVMLITLHLSPLITRAGAPLYVNLFIGNIVSVALLTWVFMPLVSRILKRWLDPRASWRASLFGVIGVLGAYAVTLVIFAFA